MKYIDNMEIFKFMQWSFQIVHKLKSRISNGFNDFPDLRT